ncbi:Gfo/Idh/MocA family oxidoreductase [Parabacteroides merdae]|uniref:Gfo/Idh/MocA family protein n=1 Tax=Parabacteroides merdae TaxID=46503 RepID=UPI003D02311E
MGMCFKAVSDRMSANDKVRIAFIGIGNRGTDISQRMFKTELCEMVALCDVDMGAPHTQKIISMFPDVPRFQDFRQMFDKMADKIDAVTVCTPDHSHFPITIEAMAHGKHVYVEKPMARTFQEVELMMWAERKFGVVTQMGNQGHSEANYFQFRAWKEAGLIKDVTAITAHMNNPRRWYEKSPLDHYTNFLLACQGKEKARSPFSVAGPLSQVFCLGVLAQRLNRKLVFDRESKQICNDPVANQMLIGSQPREGWEQYYIV